MQVIQEENQADDEQQNHSVPETIQEGKVKSLLHSKELFLHLIQILSLIRTMEIVQILEMMI